MFQKVGGTVTALDRTQSFKVATEGASSMSASDRQAQEEFQRKVARLYRAVSGAQHTAEEVQSRLKAIRGALRETPAAEKLEAAADSIEQRNREILRGLSGDKEVKKRNEAGPSPINDRG